MLNARLDEAQAGITITGRNISSLIYADDTTLMEENKDYGFWSHFMANRWGNSGNSGRLYILGLQNHCRW